MKLTPFEDQRIEVDNRQSMFDSIVSSFEEHGDIYYFYSNLYKQKYFVVSNPEWVRKILATNSTNYKKGMGIDRVRLLLGNGLMTSENPQWKVHRKMIQPSFHNNMLEKYHPVIKESNISLLERWKMESNTDHVFDFKKEMSLITLQIILKTIFSEDFDSFVEDADPYTLLSEENVRNIEFARDFRRLTSVVKNIVDSRVKEKRRPFDLLTRLLEAIDKKTNRPLSLKHMLDQVITLIVAAHETTASVLSWAWYFISLDETVKSALFEEASALLQGNFPETSDLEKLPLNNQFVQECMRLYPPGWLLTRIALSDDDLEGHHVPAGSNVLISPYILHRHPRYWDDPELFNLNRFKPSSISVRNRFSYIPFSAGARNCIGEQLAMLEMRLHLAYMIQKIKTKLISKERIELDIGINLRPKHAVDLRISIR